jgi:lia operon protein LiaG
MGSDSIVPLLSDEGSRMRIGLSCSSLVLSLTVLTAVAPSVAAQDAERHTLRGSKVAVYNIAGSVRVEGGSGSDVIVEVTRRGQDGSRLRIETGDLDRRESLRVIYPEDRIVYRGEGDESRWSSGRTSFTVHSDGTFGGGDDGWRGRRVEVRTSGSGFEGYADLRIIVPRGRGLEVNLAVGRVQVNNVEGDLTVDVHAASITTTGTRGRLNLDTGSGEVRVTDATGDVYLDTGSGRVEVSGVRGTEMRLDTGSGSVRARDVEVTDLELDSGSGNIELSRVRATDLTLDTGSGSVEVDLVADVNSLRVDSGSGGITLGIPESLGAELRIETGSGGIDVDFPLTVTRRDRDSMTATLGDGRGRIQIDTGSGGIRLRRSTTSTRNVERERD